MKAQETISGWGNIVKAENTVVYRPERIVSVEDALRESHNKTLLAIGAGRSYGDVGVNMSGVHVKMERLNRVLYFDDDTSLITVEAGVTIAEITDFAILKQHLPPVVPGTGFCTIGGALANDVHGKNHENAGSFSKYVLSFDLLLPSGQITHITRDNNEKLFKATVGGIGLTGIILTVTLKLHRSVSPALKVKRQQFKNLQNLLQGLSDIKDTYSVAWIDGAASGKYLGRGVLETAHSIGIEIPYEKSTPSKVPFYLPSFVLNRYSVKLFNSYYYHRAESCNRETFEDFRNFSFPLDALHDWNKIYGKKGFYQFQCVIPEETAEKTLHILLRKASMSGSASFLAVLKKMGKEGEGYLSFAKSGFTLALDFPNKQGVKPLLKEFEEIVLEAGGRIYLAKDALLSAENFEKMYPHKAEFLKILESIDPHHFMNSVAAKRLGIRE